MPDFTIEIMQQCASGGSDDIGGYFQCGLRTERPSCTCKGFQFRGNCKHIREAINKMCNYHQLVCGKPEKDGICPLCGHETEYVKVAV